MKIGIDLGGSHIAIGLLDYNNEITERRTYYIEKENKVNIETYITMSIIHGITEIMESCKIQLKDIEMIGIATPGNPKDGCIINSRNLGIEKFDLANELKKGFGEASFSIPIKLKNDGKCAAIAEKRFGSLREYSDCVFLCVGTGIGGAAFIDGKFLEPKRNAGFEFGHMIIKRNGEECSCGNKGCFEAYCSKKKFKIKMQQILGINDYVGANTLIEKINENLDNPDVKFLLDEYIENFAIGIANIINIFEPEAVSIGGSMSHYENVVFDKLKNRIYNGGYLFNKENPPKILVAEIGNDAGIIGATLI